MNIVHIAPNAPYNEGWGYQENLLPKYQKKLGNNVHLIVPNLIHRDGKIMKAECEEYINKEGVFVYRRGYKKYVFDCITNRVSYIPVSDILEKVRPDFIFYHGLISSTIFDVIKYKKKHEDCIIVQDNHLDYNIGPDPSQGNLKQILLQKWYVILNRISIKYVSKVYGVTPWRRQYATEYFGIPEEKTDVLLMGADDDAIDFQHRKEIRERVRKECHYSSDDFVIVSGGKIDVNKKIDILMKACSNLPGIELLIFGNVADDIHDKFCGLLSSSENIKHIGWIPSDKVYDYFFAADLVIFPGQHSVLWEQACACKVPCVFKHWEGMEHVNNNGNAMFIDTDSIDSIRNAVLSLVHSNKYNQMKSIAESENTDIYLYSKIAEKSLEYAGEKTCPSR